MIKCKLITSLCVFISTTTSFCLAASNDVTPIPPPSEIPTNIVDHSDTTKHRIAHFALGNFKGILEKTTLDNVRTIAKKGKILQQGDAAESVTWLCYTAAERYPPQRIWIASGEMGGGELITDVTAKAIPSNTKATASCPTLPTVMQAFTIDHGVRIGMSLAELNEKFGQHTSLHDGWLHYRHVEPVKDYIEVGDIYVHLIDDTVVFVNASKISSD